jgi:hypothetical protein
VITGVSLLTATDSAATAGTHTITASGGTAANYVITDVNGTLTVSQASLTVTADDQMMPFGGPLPALTASILGFVYGETAASLTTPPLVTTTATVDSPISGNPYPITASGATDSNYSISYVAGTLTVIPTPVVSISPDSLSLASSTVGTAGSTSSYTIGGVNLTADIDIVAPTGVEISDDGGITWHSSLELAESEGTVLATTILARISAEAPAGSIDGDIANTSTGAILQSIAVSGTVKASSQAGSLDTSSPQIFYGQDVTLTATFQSSASGSAPMTGTVNFYDGSTYLGTAELVPLSSINAAALMTLQVESFATVSGSASLTTSTLGVGAHLITAVYSGDANDSAASSETPVSV